LGRESNSPASLWARERIGPGFHGATEAVVTPALCLLPSFLSFIGFTLFGQRPAAASVLDELLQPQERVEQRLRPEARPVKRSQLTSGGAVAPLDDVLADFVARVAKAHHLADVDQEAGDLPVPDDEAAAATDALVALKGVVVLIEPARSGGRRTRRATSR
jgi:hypothetical protein